MRSEVVRGTSDLRPAQAVALPPETGGALRGWVSSVLTGECAALLFAALLILCAAMPTAAQPAAYSYGDLAVRLTNLQHLAVLPADGERCSQWSSYDRASYYDDATGQYVNWSANGDGTGIIRTEGSQVVLAEMEGPGCIWRIWSATPGAGHVRIYLDGASTPAVDLPFSGYFDGANAPFTYPALVHTTAANGWNNYVPIPYQNSCKITADTDWGLYFHFTYESFPAGTDVPTFTRDLSAGDAAALAKANQFLLNCGSDPAGFRPGQAVLTNLLIAAGNSTQFVAQLAGPRAITAIRLKADLPAAPINYELLRELVLQINWDNETNPAVWSPLGDFFGTAPGENIYSSLPLGCESNGWWYCYWYMPFATAAQVRLLNEGTNQLQVLFEITHAPLDQPVSTFGRFHAKWHRNALLPAEPGRSIDWTVLKTGGAGRFVGLMLHVWNPRGGWWGEGDEKFFVDGEKFPSTFGTGSEDYFGYAWSSGTVFHHAYHNQTHNDRNSRGHLSVSRWHLGDAVPFQETFEAAIEKYFSDFRPTLYAATVFWYLAPGGTDSYGPVPLNERSGYWVPPEVYRMPGVLEGEDLQIFASSGGTAQTQEMSGFSGSRWSGDAQLWWTGAQPGDWLDLLLPVTNASNYRLILQFTKARDYGIVQLHLDGQPAGSQIDLYDPNVVTGGERDLGLFNLDAGQHLLRIEIVGANPGAIPAYMAGIDYVRLEPPLALVDALSVRYPNDEIAVVFSQPVNPATATNVSRYALNSGNTIVSARMGAGIDTVLLRTSKLSPNATNVLTVNGVTDLMQPPNTLFSNSIVAIERKLNTWLRLDDGAGTDAMDWSGNSRHGTLHNGVAPGQVGKILGAFAFDGTDDYVQLQEGYSDFSRGMTVALWAKPGAIDFWARYIDLGNGNNSDNILFARNAATDQLTFEVYRGGTSGGKITTPAGTLQLVRWQHLAATLDPAGLATVFVDGFPMATGRTAVPEIVLRLRNYLGRSNWTVDDYYTGKMDDFRIYDRALAPAAVRALAQEAEALNTPILAISVTGETARIDFHGNLLSADSLLDPEWRLVPEASVSPYFCPVSSTQKYFRAVLP